MGYQDRDWYRESGKAKQKATYNPRMFRRARSSPPEPHEWPTWIVVVAVLVAFAVAVVLAKRYLDGKPLIPRSSVHTIQLPSCSAVASGPCFK